MCGDIRLVIKILLLYILYCMKQLLIIRHAKSSWDFSDLSDFNRSLNERGHRDAPAMAKRILAKSVQLDAIVSSPANRALTTATYFAAAYNFKAADIITIKELYHASVKVFYETISKLDNKLHTVALFSHNPGITEFINELTTTTIDNMPTCGIYAVKIKTDSWKDFKKAEKDFWFFDYPKNA